MITAPFNFVPLSEKVFFPSWAEDVSHDVPFEDGESGVIDITITAKSPMFIRNHYVNGDDYVQVGDKRTSTQFCHHNNTPYIPGSSVKGMVRNVLEIMSFGKLKIDKKQHSKITSVRDMTNRKELVGTATGCGFLKKDKLNNWIIVDYGKPRTIKYTSNKIIENGNIKINCDFETAREKYENNSKYSVVSIKTDIKDLTNRDGKKIGTKNIATISNNGENAYLILTGGIDNKKNEFIFADSDKNSNQIKNIDKAVSKFKDVYFNSDSIDGNFWRDNYDENIGIPIFYIKKNNQLSDIGLSQLFKLAYNHTIEEATKQTIETTLRKEKKYQKLDLVETIFGAIQEEIVEDEKSKKDSYALKGRVQFSHFKCDSTPKPYGKVYTVLGSPNPSFYPEYIQQNCQDDGKVQNDKYNTLMERSSKIAGWKRYPLRCAKPDFKKAEEGTDSATTFTPIGNYSGNNFNEFTFSGKLRYHNLKKAELGAILSALTWHGNSDDFYHNIGMAKSLGFGKIKIDISLDANEQIDLLQKYENLMESELNNTWLQSEQIKELFTMSNKSINIDSKLEYLILDPQGSDDFRESKKDKKCLPLASKISKIDNNLKSLFDKTKIESFLDTEDRKQKVIEEKKEKLETEEKLLANTPNKTSKEFKKAIEQYVTSNITLPYYDYSDLKKVFENKKDDIVADDIYYAYEDLAEKDSFKFIEPLLRKREKNLATDLELAELYALLKKE